MRGRIRLNRHKHHISLRISHPISIRTSISRSMRLSINMHCRININHHTSRTGTHLSNRTHKEGVVETSEEEEEEEYLVEEEVRLHAITVDNRVTVRDISWNLQRHVPILRDMIIMWRNVLS